CRSCARLTSNRRFRIPMDRVLLQVRKKKDRHRLEEWLSRSYHILLPHSDKPLEEEFDLAILDGPSLRELRPSVRARRKAEEPVFLPFLLLTVRRQGSMPTRH